MTRGLARGDGEERSQCEVRLLPEAMFIPEAVEYVMDRSGEKGTECGFSATSWTDKIKFFAEGLRDCVRYPAPGPITFHTHPTQADLCHPSPDDVLGKEEGDIGIIGCPEMDEVVYFRKTGDEGERFGEVFERDAEIEEEFERREGRLTEAIEAARGRGEHELAERLSWDRYEAARNYRSDKIMNQMRFKHALRDNPGFLGDFRADFPMERILELEQERRERFKLEQFEDMAKHPDWREKVLNARPEWRDEFEEYLGEGGSG